MVGRCKEALGGLDASSLTMTSSDRRQVASLLSLMRLLRGRELADNGVAAPRRRHVHVEVGHVAHGEWEWDVEARDGWEGGGRHRGVQW